MPYSTRATSGGRGGGRVGSSTRIRHESQSSPHRSDSFEDEDEDSDEEDPSIPATIVKKRKRKTPTILPTIHNYHELGLEWGQTRTPATSLFEAQALQAQYNLDKTMLCVAEGISRSTLNASL
ncbi:uncharacterized protein MELLADRAFT_96412 [Melampsora larici-populina 98AG31]|uniref:Uncharacterized protein n=1 Tax=Melampsora larici-populina (strain 98AG31 / pathotype 3-4-7) TaxID=747676 RepID=F4REQ5_MELLP|nr:uncharacterized protein MELLADRAFT_96412 [Melampsora larici-populina 98AG31]EGG09238.1 hypothetical protein MELLADRAFT_96412 [Melampsora larici-populina 98AG31]